MKQLFNQFQTIPYPFKFCDIPHFGEKKVKKRATRKFFANQICPGLTREALKIAGFSETKDSRKCNLEWGKQLSAIEFHEIRTFQKINHFSGSFSLGRKNSLHQRMKWIKKHFAVKFYPNTFVIPQDSIKLSKKWKKKELWIFKPKASSRGRGVRVISSKEKPVPRKSGIIQVYIRNPLIITQRKFDLRLYAFVTSVSPLRIYQYTNGLARFASHQYTLDPTDKFVHITNFSINKRSPDYVKNSDSERIENSKWSLQFFYNYLETNFPNIDIPKLKKEIEKIIALTLISGFYVIGPHHQKNVTSQYSAFELFGIDLMIDENFNCYLIEVNISPSLGKITSSFEDHIKIPLVLDILRMGRIIECNSAQNKPAPGSWEMEKEMARSWTDKRKKIILENKIDPWKNPTFGDIQIIRDFVEEKIFSEGFKRIYPKRKTMKQFTQCLDQPHYPDYVFQRWIEMNNSQRIESLNRGWNNYKLKMESITRDVEAL